MVSRISQVDDNQGQLKRVALINFSGQVFPNLPDLLLNHDIEATFVYLNVADFPVSHNIACDAAIIFSTTSKMEEMLIIPKILNNRNRPGIIFISRNANHLDRILALELGADDCTDMAARPIEIVARLRALFRRQAEYASLQHATTPSPLKSRILRFNEWEFDKTSLELTTPAGEKVPITGFEVKLLIALTSNPGVIHSRNDLAYMCRGKKDDNSGRTIDVHISRFRRKIACFDSRALIKTVHGRGYLFAPMVDEN